MKKQTILCLMLIMLIGVICTEIINASQPVISCNNLSGCKGEANCPTGGDLTDTCKLSCFDGSGITCPKSI